MEKRKRKILTIVGVISLVVGMALNMNASKSNASKLDVKLSNVTALATAESSDTVNGHGQLVECGGIFNGTQRLVCMASNPYNCQPEDCF